MKAAPPFTESHKIFNWRIVTSTYLMFMARREALAEFAGAFRSYNQNSDLGLWMALTKKARLQSVVMDQKPWRRIVFPRLALLGVAPRVAADSFLQTPDAVIAGTCAHHHMDSSGLVPGVDWKKIFGARAKALKAAF